MPQPYNLVKDDQDIRVPSHSDEEFFHGICFQAKVSLRVYFESLTAGIKLKINIKHMVFSRL